MSTKTKRKTTAKAESKTAIRRRVRAAARNMFVDGEADWLRTHRRLVRTVEDALAIGDERTARYLVGAAVFLNGDNADAVLAAHAPDDWVRLVKRVRTLGLRPVDDPYYETRSRPTSIKRG